MQIKIKLEVLKLLSLEFELSSPGKKKEGDSNEKKELPAPSTPSK
jgi:hypothetical protein